MKWNGWQQALPAVFPVCRAGSCLSARRCKPSSQRDGREV